MADFITKKTLSWNETDARSFFFMRSLFDDFVFDL